MNIDNYHKAYKIVHSGVLVYNIDNYHKE